MLNSRKTTRFLRLAGYIGLLVFLLSLLSSCAFFNQGYTWEKQVEARYETIHHIEDSLDTISQNVWEIEGASVLVATLNKIQGINHISQVGNMGARFQFDDGTWGNVIIDISGSEEKSPSSVNTLPNHQKQIEFVNKYVEKAEAQYACTPWTSGKALVALAPPLLNGSMFPYDDYRAAVHSLRNAGYDVDDVFAEQFTPWKILELAKYGVVILMGHADELTFQTGVPWDPEHLKPYEDLDKNGQIEPCIIVHWKVTRTYIGFNADLIPNGLPNSLVYMDGCRTASPWDHANWVHKLQEKGAAVVLGNSGTLWMEAIGNGARAFCKYFFEDSYQLGEAVEKTRKYGLFKPSCLKFYGDPSIRGGGWPKAKFSATPTTGTAPLKVAFDASGSHDPDADTLTYQWFFGDGAKATGKTTSHTYEQGGDYKVTLFATDPCGHEAKATTTIHVKQNPCETETEPPILTLNCPPTASSGDANFSWSATDNCSNSNEISFSYKLDGASWSNWVHTTSKSYSNLAAGSHSFCVKAKDKLGNESDPKCCQFEVNPCLSDNTPPSVTLDCPQGVSNGNVTLTWHGKDNCTPESEIQYQYCIYELWSQWATETSKTYADLPSGSYNFCVRAKDGSGNISKEVCCTFVVNKCLNDSTPPSLSLNCGNPSGSGDIDFSWSASDNCTPASQLEYRHKLGGYESWSNWGYLKEAHYHGVSPGSYTFCVQAKDSNGNTAQKCCPVIVQECTNSPQIWTDKSTYCIGDPITVYMKFTAPCTASLLDEKQSGYSKYLFQDSDYSAGTYTLNGKVDGPAGSETLTLYSTACGSTESDSVTITVEDCNGNISPGNTSFHGKVLSEPVIYGAKEWVVQIEGVDSGVNILPLGQVSVVMGIYPGCLGRALGDIQPGDTVWVFGYFDGSKLDLCPNEAYYITNYGRPI